MGTLLLRKAQDDGEQKSERALFDDLALLSRIYIHATNLVERPRASADVHQIQRRWRLNRHVCERSPPDVVVRGEREPSGHVHRAQRGGMDGRYDERFENARDWERRYELQTVGRGNWGVFPYVSVRPTGASGVVCHRGR